MSAMATQVKRPAEAFTRGELKLFLQHIEDDKLLSLAKASAAEREAIVRVHTGLWQIAAGEPRRSKAA